MIVKCSNPSIVFRPEPIRVRFSVAPKNFFNNGKFAVSPLVPNPFNHKEQHESHNFDEFYQNLKDLGINNGKINKLINNNTRIKLGIKEILWISQELEWRKAKSWITFLRGNEFISVPERPVNPMTKDSLFIKKENQTENETMKSI